MSSAGQDSAIGYAYRGVTATVGAALRPIAAWKGGDLAERLALTGPDATPGGVWLHGASVGELNSARVLSRELSRDLPIYVTANSVTGRDTARAWGVPASLAPLDTPAAVRRFLDRVKPRVAITIENEIWPNRARILGKRGIGQVIVGARMSDRSAAKWARLPGLIGPVLSAVDALSAQDGETEMRLLRLGLRADALLPRLNLKLLGPARRESGEVGAHRDRTVLVASTHEGEDGPILEAWLTAHEAQPDLRLILAPRHPARADEIAELLDAAGLPFLRRSAGGDESAPVLLADTIGEMARWYDAASICVTGGSFVPKGGHTPWEPASHENAILHGPYVDNFREDYAALDLSGGSALVSPASLADALIRLGADAELRGDMGRSALRILRERAGDPTELLDRIRALAKS